MDPASRRELDDLHSKVAHQKQEILDLTNELCSYRRREEEAAARLASQLADSNQLRAELADTRDELQERDRQLQLARQQLRTRQAQVEGQWAEDPGWTRARQAVRLCTVSDTGMAVK